MNEDLATHISLLAAPLYAAFLAAAIRAVGQGSEVPAEILSALRRNAIIQAHALWLDVLEYKT